MKTILRSLCCLLLFQTAMPGKALNPDKGVSAYQHLYEVNKQWAKYKTQAPAELKHFETDIDRIQYHLLLVHKNLSENTPKNIEVQSIPRRNELLNALQEYANGRKFPTNTGHSARRPYFIDNYGVYCAVGHLISVSGNDELAQEIKWQHNYDYLLQIKTRGLAQWAQTFGFTTDELAWIQPTYMQQNNIVSVGGPNGPINSAQADFQGRLIFEGNFDSIQNLACFKTGYYHEGKFGCLGGGLQGIINDMLVNASGIYVAGSIVRTDSTFPLAIFYGNSWKYISITNRPNAVGVAVCNQGAALLEVVIKHPTAEGKQEIWAEEGGVWRKRAEINGEVKNVESTDFGICYVGHFDTVTVLRYNKPDTIVVAKNVVINEYSAWLGINTWRTLGADVSDTVLVCKQIGNALYFGGTCSNENGKTETCLSRYMNQTLQPLVLHYDMFAGRPTCSINAIQVYNESSLLLGGEFAIDPMLGNVGKNLALYHVFSKGPEAFSTVNGKVTSLCQAKGSWYISGHFTGTDASGKPIQYLGRIATTTSLGPLDGQVIEWKIYPNPAKKLVHIEFADEQRILRYALTDVSGSQIGVQNMTENASKITVDVSALQAGLFFVTIETESGQILQKTFTVR